MFQAIQCPSRNFPDKRDLGLAPHIHLAFLWRFHHLIYDVLVQHINFPTVIKFGLLVSQIWFEISKGEKSRTSALATQCIMSAFKTMN